MRKLVLLLAVAAFVAAPMAANAKAKKHKKPHAAAAVVVDPNESGRRLVGNMLVAFFWTPMTSWATWSSPAPVVAKY